MKLIVFSKNFRYVFWYHNERMINYDSERGISVTTTPGRRTHSQLSIQKADVSDSGNYTCAPSSALPASIHVFVSGRVINFKMNPWIILFWYKICRKYFITNLVSKSLYFIFQALRWSHGPVEPMEEH